MNKRTFEDIWKRSLPEGGFASRPGGRYRADSTAWAIVAMRACGIEAQRLQTARQRLSADQQPDGRVTLSTELPGSFWPTPLAVLAWQSCPEFSLARSRAVSFLLNTAGHHFRRAADSPAGHDTSIPGWPWIEGTHSWVEPTSLAMIALRTAAHGSHERVSDGARLLLDRQLSRGGWNYGNTTVFGTELAPMPESTGLALSALPGLASRETVSRSIALMKDAVRSLKTPISLGWAILGLSAWGERPGDADDLIDRCLGRQSRYGAYDTSMVGLMIVARKAEGGLLDVFA